MSENIRRKFIGKHSTVALEFVHVSKVMSAGFRRCPHAAGRVSDGDLAGTGTVKWSPEFTEWVIDIDPRDIVDLHEHRACCLTQRDQHE